MFCNTKMVVFSYVIASQVALGSDEIVSLHISVLTGFHYCLGTRMVSESHDKNEFSNEFSH